MGLRGPPKGTPRTPGSGRQKGTPNKSTQALQEKLDRLGCDPIEAMARLVLNDLPCGVCEGKGHLPDGGGTMSCRVCNGRGRERVEPELRGRMAAELAQYLYPKRKAVEHSGPDGEELSFRVMLERARKRAGLED